jgi:hypothetical protein
MPPSTGPSIVSASTIRPSRLARCQVTPAASSARSQRRSASSMVRDGGQVNPGGILLPFGFATLERRASLARPRVPGAAAAVAAARAMIATPANAPAASMRRITPRP